MISRKKIFLNILFLLFILLLAGCAIIPVSDQGIIQGKVFWPIQDNTFFKDIYVWFPIAGTVVELVDANGNIHISQTDKDGDFVFQNIATRANAIISATVKIDNKTLILKGIIPKNIAINENYNVGTLTPKTTAFALIVEELLKRGIDVKLEMIESADSFTALVEQIEIDTEEGKNIIDDPNIDKLMGKIINQLYPQDYQEEQSAAVRIKDINISTDPVVDEELENPVVVTVTLSTETSGVNIYYTLDGSIPGLNSDLYKKPFLVKTDKPEGEIITVKAIGNKKGMINSRITEKEIAFKSRQYTISFESNGGSQVTELIGEYGSLINKPDDPEREGYTFLGWYRESAFENEWDFTLDRLLEDITLYARWEPIYFTLNYSVGINGVVNGKTSQKIKFGEDGSTVEAIANKNYYFVKWSDGCTENPRTDKSVTKDILVEAIFEKVFVIDLLVKRDPFKVSYFEDESLDLEGLEVTLIYNDNSSLEIPFTGFTENGIAVEPQDGTMLVANQHHGLSLSISHLESGITVTGNCLTVVTRALFVTDESTTNIKKIKITSNYGDVIFGNSITTINRIDPPTNWTKLGKRLKIRVTTGFPENMNSLVLAPDETTDTVIISGTKRQDYVVQLTALTLEICDNDYDSVIKSFDISVSGVKNSPYLSVN